jgi:hypothetical protein
LAALIAGEEEGGVNGAATGRTDGRAAAGAAVLVSRLLCSVRRCSRLLGVCVRRCGSVNWAEETREDLRAMGLWSGGRWAGVARIRGWCETGWSGPRCCWAIER